MRTKIIVPATLAALLTLGAAACDDGADSAEPEQMESEEMSEDMMSEDEMMSEDDMTEDEMMSEDDMTDDMTEDDG